MEEKILKGTLGLRENTLRRTNMGRGSDLIGEGGWRPVGGRKAHWLAGTPADPQSPGKWEQLSSQGWWKACRGS